MLRAYRSLAILALAALLIGIGPGVSRPASAATSAASAAELSDAASAGLLVRFSRSASDTLIRQAIAVAGGHFEEAARSTGFVVVSTGSRPKAAVAAALVASPFVEDVAPNRIRRAAAVPNDPGYSVQQTYLQAMHLPDAWEVTTGTDGLVLAVLDSGVQLDHPDLAGRLVPGWDFVNNDASPDDDQGHGTMVAGIAAASTNHGRGIAGATWQGKIMPVKVLDSSGAATDADIAAGIRWAADHGADVINLSLGGPGASTILQEAVDYAIARDVVLVAAAGNEGDGDEATATTPNYPAACAGVVAVGATDNAGNRASFSSYGNWVDVVAPGVTITSTTRAGGYGSGSGTSFSSPLVAAVTLMMRTADPNAGQATVAQRLLRSARDLGAPGTDSTFGAGMVDAAAALAITATPGDGSSTAPPAPGPDPVIVTNPPAPPVPADPGIVVANRRSGYWMVGSDGKVYAFGDARWLGDAPTSSAVDLEPTPSGNGYWIVDDLGRVFAFGDATSKGNVAVRQLGLGEKVTSLSATSDGGGYWIFTNRGRVLTFGNAAFLGDVSHLALAGPVLDSIVTPSGNGYYMVASDGGIFAFGDAKFYGSMGGKRLNAPVQSLVPDADRIGYWLVASDGGIFAFQAEFKGSMGSTRLNRPVTGMVRAGGGYLMVGEDGGIFDFSGTADGFKGSLGANPPTHPIASVAVLESR